MQKRVAGIRGTIKTRSDPFVVMQAHNLEKTRMEHEDAQLLAQYRRGDTQALERLVAKYHQPLFGFLARFARQAGEADDWFQETWVRAIRNMNRFRQKNFRGWLFRIAHNLIIDSIRRRKPELSLDATAADGAPPLRDFLPAPGLTPAAQATGRALGQNIVAAVSQLPPEQQEVFWLRMEANLPFREIARIQRCSINTALARMQYALTKLRTQLAPIYREWQENSP